MNLFSEFGWPGVGGRSGASSGLATAASRQPTQTQAFGPDTGSTVDAASLSTRAEKLSALNQEFNIRGPGFELSSAFIERLQQFGFISGREAESLGADIAAAGQETGNRSPAESATRLSSLRSTISEFRASLADDTPLAGILERVDTALGTIESRDGQADNRMLETVRSQLDAFLNSDLAGSIDGPTEKSLTQAMDVLLIASRLTPGSQTNAGIETYLANT